MGSPEPVFQSQTAPPDSSERMAPEASLKCRVQAIGNALDEDKRDKAFEREFQ